MSQRRRMTPAQLNRQRSRERDGKYTKHNPCYACGKSAGESYWSHPDTDGLINDQLLVLCGSCYGELSKLPGPEAVQAAACSYGEPKQK